MSVASGRPAVTPNRTFALVVGISAGLIVAIGWSTHHLLVAGAPAAALGNWPGVSCLLIPAAGDLAPHLASYGFLMAILTGLAIGMRVLLNQHLRTRALVTACLVTRAPRDPDCEALARALGLESRLDIVDVPARLAFCYGYLRPRIAVSHNLVQALAREQLVALLVHEREHLRQRDPLKVAAGRLLASALFFLPAVGALYRRYLLEKELAADDAVIAELGSSRSLAAALTVLLDGAGRRPALTVGADEALEARIDALLGEPIRLGLRLGQVPLLGSAVAVLLAILPLLLAPPPAAASRSGPSTPPGCHLTVDVSSGSRPAALGI